MFEVSRRGEVFVVTMRGGENRFTAAFLAEFNGVLDEVERDAAQAGALVVTAEGKYWSNGIDLETLAASGAQSGGDFVAELERLLGRVLTLPVPTVAAINGHAFAGGAILALAHDYRVMREDRGWFCFPEVDIHIPFTRGMSALLSRKLAPNVQRDAVLLGRRYTAPEALDAGLVDATAAEDRVLERAVELAQPLAGKGRVVVGQLKRGMYSEVARALGFGKD